MRAEPAPPAARGVKACNLRKSGRLGADGREKRHRRCLRDLPAAPGAVSEPSR